MINNINNSKKMEWNFTMKVVLISSFVVSMGLAMRVSVPSALEFMASHMPLVWSSVVSWLRPPYLYVVINAIIISIAVSSRFHHHHHQDHDQKSSEDYDHRDHDRNNHHLGCHDHEQKVNKDISWEFRMMEDDRTVVMHQRGEDEEEFSNVDDDEQVKTVVEVISIEEFKDVDNHDDDEEELMMALRSEQEKKIVLSTEKPLASVASRFGDRKPVKTSPAGGKALKVTSKSKQQHETLENTWKAIMEARSMSFNRQVKTWEYNLENQGRQIIGFGDLEHDQAPSAPTMMKCETFKDRTNQDLPAVSTTNGKLRKEPSLSQEELNTRVEAFIEKFNEQMRLQRLESLNQYMEMINRGSH